MHKKLLELLATYSAQLVAISGLITTILGLLSQLTSFFAFKVPILLTGILLLVWGIGLFARHALKEVLPGGIKIYRFRQLRETLWVRIASNKLLSPMLIALTWCLVCGLSFMESVRQVACEGDPEKTYLVLAQFNQQNEDFSSRLYTAVEDLITIDSVELRAYDRYVSPMAHLKDTLAYIRSLQCSDRGVIVHGQHKPEEGVFYGTIRVENLRGITRDIVIADPNLIAFTIENQAKQVALFIASVLMYEIGELDRAVLNFNTCLEEKDSTSKSNYIGWCHTFLGNIAMHKRNYGKARHHFEHALQQEPNNETAAVNYERVKQKLIAVATKRFDSLKAIAALPMLPDTLPTIEHFPMANARGWPSVTISGTQPPTTAAESLQFGATPDPITGDYLRIRKPDPLPQDTSYQVHQPYYLGETNAVHDTTIANLVQFMTANPSTKIIISTERINLLADTASTANEMTNLALIHSTALVQRIAADGIRIDRLSNASNCSYGDYQSPSKATFAIIWQK